MVGIQGLFFKSELFQELTNNHPNSGHLHGKNFKNVSNYFHFVKIFFWIFLRVSLNLPADAGAIRLIRRIRREKPSSFRLGYQVKEESFSPEFI
jgi:hypothetical protein